ncbi:MAG: hypothetical protein RLP02_04800 [Coleofasciculus sp. C2-GNP5-27]
MKLTRIETIEVFGMIAVVMSLIFVGYELRKTQTAMQAESSNIRAQMAIDRNILNVPFFDANQKLQSGQQLTREEFLTVRQRNDFNLRYFENLHFQWQLGVLDEEIWDSNLFGLSGMINSDNFKVTHPEWFEVEYLAYRASFAELTRSLRQEF